MFKEDKHVVLLNMKNVIEWNKEYLRLKKNMQVI